MDKGTEKLLLYGGLAAGAYVLVLRPLLEQIGINPAATAAVSAQDAVPPAANPFNQAFLGSSITTNWPAIKSQYDSGAADGSANDLVYSAAENIYGAFHDISNQWFGSDFQRVLAAFQSLQYQYEVAAVDQYLQQNYQLSLWPLLRDGYPFLPLTNIINNGLNANNLQQILTYVNSLPPGISG